MKKKLNKKEKLNSNENLFDLNIIKYFYLNMTRLDNISKVSYSYINSFKSEVELKQCFQYQFNFLSFSTQRVEKTDRVELNYRARIELLIPIELGS